MVTANSMKYNHVQSKAVKLNETFPVILSSGNTFCLALLSRRKMMSAANNHLGVGGCDAVVGAVSGCLLKNVPSYFPADR